MSQWYVVTRDLTHALVFIKEARDTPHEELRKQHLDEAQRLVENANSIVRSVHGEAKAE